MQRMWQFFLYQWRTRFYLTPDSNNKNKGLLSLRNKQKWIQQKQTIKTKKRSHLSEMITAEKSRKASYGASDQQSNSSQFTGQKSRGKE